MKKSFLKISALGLMLAVMSANTFAQERPDRRRDASGKVENQNTREPMQRGMGMFNIPNATEEQKALLKEMSDKRAENEKALEATYTAKQKEIAANTSMNFRDKRAALSESYTDAQKEMVKKRSEELREIREKLNKTLTEEQRTGMRANGGQRQRSQN
ncbi:hypothetical protein Pedsa_1066 [Pseudopedobacter saltans DSM 12145]|uniref:Uncharacterized protein n=1 Tax=Pseudopedobacter saltans (strain ATCC 51119 / DSM 12145 / JCM 21818 / CCUG 39354 / LMG 10337 / NBRC 100064 / NCIMB 13643) TaxID=762903 RepID=F0SBJ0_PSESL|nr:hypothetical protein [Pseudopedobacter saltans]ADY51636.1 hypothetical protein Pedsa_1066 [Pseudopedobacter saltans DSM 12145]